MMLFVLLTTIPGSCAVAQEILKAPSSLSTLDERWNWAQQQIERREFSKGGWIAFSIDKMMNEDSWIGSFSTFPDENKPSFYELITGMQIQDPTEDVRQRARQTLSRMEKQKSGKKVLKEIAFLLRIPGANNPERRIEAIKATNITLRVDVEELPVVWLGKSGTDESLSFFISLYKAAKTNKEKKQLLMACGMHENPGASGFLRSVVEGKEEELVRSEAVFWMGQQDADGTLEFLTEVAKTDKSREVSEKAVFAISQLDRDEATDVLIALGRTASSRSLKKKAIFWLGQRASSKAAESLAEFVYQGEDIEVQKQAVFALTQLKQGGGVTEIIKVAKSHRHPEIRKQAIFWLGQSDDPRAFETIVEIAKGK